MIGRSGRHRQGDLYQVRLQITVPGAADVMIDRNPSADHAHEDPYVAIRDAFAAARRRLQDIRRRAQGQKPFLDGGHFELPRGNAYP